MTPKEKAMYLCERFPYRMDESKEYALFVVEEILNSEPRYPSNVDWDDCGATHQYYYEAQIEEALNYWQQVKQEIENL